MTGQGAGRLARRRIRLVVTLAVFGFGAISARAAWLGVVRHDDFAARAVNETRRTIDIPAPRGQILARDRSELAVDKPAVFVSANPARMAKVGLDRAEVARDIAPILGMKAADVEAKISGTAGYVPLTKRLAPDRAKALRALRVDGIETRDIQERTYPGAPVASQLVGFVNVDGTLKRVGAAGIEARYERILTGVDGRVDELRDPSGQTVRILGNRPPSGGKTIRTTIDPEIQGVVDETVARVFAETKAKSVSAVVMRVSDGAIFATGSAPSFDPNDRTHLTSDQLNIRAVTNVFEPGSVFKLVTFAGAIDEGIVSPGTSFYVEPKFSIFGEDIGEAHARGAQNMTVARIAQVSSNVGTIKIARLPNNTAGQDRFLRWANRLGFGRATGVDIPAEDGGAVRTKWDGLSIYNFPIGQGILVNLMQLTRAYAAVANGGSLVTPHVVERVGGAPVRYPAPERVMKASTAAALNQMLQGVVSDAPGATGARAEIPGFSVAGKTGTANIFDPELVHERTGKKGAYSTTKHYSSFVGFVPANRPRLAIAVAVEQPGGAQYYGGEVAAPAFRSIAEASLNVLGVRPDRPTPTSAVASPGG